MPKIYRDITQGSVEWLRLHVGKPTASEFGNIMTPKFAQRTGDMVSTYLSKKVAEAWRGEPLPGFFSWDCEQGQLLEEEAIPWFELEHDEVTLDRIGFVESDDGRCGCSPDSLIGEDEGLEIKCPAPHTHVGYVLDKVVPEKYLPQIHGSLYVTGRKRWRFLSYRRGFPALEVIIERDEEIMQKIGKVLSDFYVKFDTAMAALKQAEL